MAKVCENQKNGVKANKHTSNLAQGGRCVKTAAVSVKRRLCKNNQAKKKYSKGGYHPETKRKQKPAPRGGGQPINIRFH